MSASNTYDLIVAGGGAAGFFSAIRTAEKHPNWKILILEKSAKLLSKVLISGGGRCNVTHHCFDVEELCLRYPRGGDYLKPHFWAFGPEQTQDWFESKNVPLKTESDGRMFPTSDSSGSIANCLLKSAERANIKVQTREGLERIEQGNGTYTITTDKETYACRNLVLAFGGLPKLIQYDLLGNLNLDIVDPVPSLFTFNIEMHPLRDLSGVSVPDAEVQVVGLKRKDRGPLLITHWGLSGPAVLRSSAWLARELHDKDYRFQVAVNWTGQDKNAVIQSLKHFAEQHPKKQIVSHSPLEHISTRLWQSLAGTVIKESYRNWAESGKKTYAALADKLCSDVYQADGKTTFKEEFVTAGGISLDNLDENFQLKEWPGIYVAGELADIDGITGGFNFQAAWTAGDAIARVIR
ncbi:MAG: aminoacetone oxidase family FAD-binding enzyme [Bacteroidetes bacterium]|nr:MAG: aminoacetone oxidase family FAD-binding enzyme [Bacteroidota bacterium]